MKYTELVKSVLGKISDKQKKAALDLAKSLDHPALQIDLSTYHGWDVGDAVKRREDIFHFLSAVFFHHQLPLPAFEDLFYQVFLPKEETFDRYSAEQREKINSAIRHARAEFKSRGKGQSKLVRQALATAAVMEMFALNSSINVDNLRAVINRALIANGLQPIRPNYSEMSMSFAVDEVASPKEAKVLIVDDRMVEIMRSAKKLVGWPNLALDFYLVTKELIATTAEKIIAAKPDIVLMDQEMGDIKGDFLIEYLSRRGGEGITYVANTGGGGEGMKKIGVLNNFAKGEDVRAFREALKKWSLR